MAKANRTSAPRSSSRKAPRSLEPRDSRAAPKIEFSATLHSPRRTNGRAVSWTFLTLPKEASARLPARGMVTVEGSLEGVALRATLEPDAMANARRARRRATSSR